MWGDLTQFYLTFSITSPAPLVVLRTLDETFILHAETHTRCSPWQVLARLYSPASCLQTIAQTGSTNDTLNTEVVL
jgi:hypothetical protein